MTVIEAASQGAPPSCTWGGHGGGRAGGPAGDAAGLQRTAVQAAAAARAYDGPANARELERHVREHLLHAGGPPSSGDATHGTPEAA
eukprot:jgi/Ulvmu1/11921/UM081_0081.1